MPAPMHASHTDTSVTAVAHSPITHIYEGAGEGRTDAVSGVCQGGEGVGDGRSRDGGGFGSWARQCKGGGGRFQLEKVRGRVRWSGGGRNGRTGGRLEGGRRVSGDGLKADCDGLVASFISSCSLQVGRQYLRCASRGRVARAEMLPCLLHLSPARPATQLCIGLWAAPSLVWRLEGRWVMLREQIPAMDLEMMLRPHSCCGRFDDWFSPSKCTRKSVLAV
jgi:hypothetical protein